MNPPAPPLPTPPVRARWMAAIRRLSLLAACLAVACSLFYGIENWRGSRIWSAELAALRENQIPVTPEEIVPPALPEDQNFANLQPFVDAFDFRTNSQGSRGNTNLQRALDWLNLEAITGNHSPGSPASGRWPTGSATDLLAWQSYFRRPPKLQRKEVAAARLRLGLASPKGETGSSNTPAFPVPELPGRPAEDVLLALKVFDAQFDAIATATQRLKARYPIPYEDGPYAILPHLALIKQMTRTIALRGTARLEEGQTAPALQDLLTSLALAESLRDEPLLISQLVRFACVTIALQTAWEGQVHHRWSADQLLEIERALAPIDTSAGMRGALRGERMIAINIVERMARSSKERREMSDMFDPEVTARSASGNGPFGVLTWLNDSYLVWAPRGWFYSSLAETSRSLRLLETIPPSALDSTQRQWPPAPPSDSLRYRLYDAFLRPKWNDGLPIAMLKAHRVTAQARLALTACALERHRIAQGAYPSALESLVPRWLDAIPLDPINQQPLRYRIEPEDSFRLWSVGTNAADDGGRPDDPAKASEAGTDFVWTWRH